MKCANPLCQHHLLYLRGGTLRLLELECTSESRLQRDSGGFPVFDRAVRYFWLCPECSRILVLRRWTEDGLVLESQSRPAGKAPPTWTVRPEPAVDAENLLHFRRTFAKPA